MLIFMIGVIVYKLLVYRPLAKSSLTSSYALQIANISGAVCNLMCIMILSRVCRYFLYKKTFIVFALFCLSLDNKFLFNAHSHFADLFDPILILVAHI